MNKSISFQGEEYTLREATVVDLEIILHHRRSMFLDMGHRDEAAVEAMLTTSRPFFSERLADGRYRAWLVENSLHQVVSGGGVNIFDFPSSVTDPSSRRAIIVNMYTERPYRRKGIARKLMETMIVWCREQGLGSVLLHASEEGRPLYQQLGFKATNEMRLML